MASEINDSSGSEAPKNGRLQNDSSNDTQVVLAGPKVIVTPKTGQAPRGKIIEDVVRGTVFWEIAESSEEEDNLEGGPSKPDEKWGNPFKVEWIKWFLQLHLDKN